MIWNNPGHELDEVGSRYLNIKNIRIFGFDNIAKKTYEFIKWLGIESDFDITFIWDTTEHENESVSDCFCGKKVIKYNSDSKNNEIIDSIEDTVVVLKDREQTRRLERIKKMGVEHIFFMKPSHLGKDNFVQNFVCVYMMYKYGKLVSHWTNYLVTMRCNLNCKYCLNYNNYLKNPEDITMDAFENHFEILFDKFDYLYSLHFTGGETQLTKDLDKKIAFLGKYKNRIFDFFIITNGTIVPNDRVLEAVKTQNGWFLIDDYTDSVSFSKIDEIKNKLDKYGIEYIVSKAPYWMDLSIDRYEYECKEKEDLVQHKNNCHNYLHEFADGNIYACCYQQYAYRAGKGVLEDDDYISIKDKSKMEILEFRQGYSINGYTSLCHRCRGLGDTAKQVEVAEQIRKGVIS